jgi:hypothetical protein
MSGTRLVVRAPTCENLELPLAWRISFPQLSLPPDHVAMIFAVSR